MNLIANRLSLLILFLGATIAGCGSPSRTEFKSKDDYLAARKELIAKEQRMTFSAGIVLSPIEQKADRYLNALRQIELTRVAASFPPAQNFLIAKPIIDQSPVLEVFRQMPKGAILHAHPGAISDLHWLIKHVSYLPNCYIYTGADTAATIHGTFAFAAKAPSDDWQLLATLRAQSNDVQRFDEQLYQSITLGAADVPKGETWPLFEKCWSRVGALECYQEVYREFLLRELQAAAMDNVDVLELRDFLSGPADLDGKRAGPAATVAIYRDVLKQIRRQYPDFRLKIIYSRERVAPPVDVGKYLQIAVSLQETDPDFVKGFDLVNEEDRSRPLIDSLEQFLSAVKLAHSKNLDLRFFFHAGESSRTDNGNLYEALLLNSQRIGHGLALGKHPLLLELIRQRRIAIEVCPISNQVLGYVPDLRNHPALFWLRSGNPITLNPDDPGMMGSSLSHDFYEAFMAWDLNLADLKQLALNSIQYSTLDAVEKRDATEIWQRKWDLFVQHLAAMPIPAPPATPGPHL